MIERIWFVLWRLLRINVCVCVFVSLRKESRRHLYIIIHLMNDFALHFNIFTLFSRLQKKTEENIYLWLKEHVIINMVYVCGSLTRLYLYFFISSPSSVMELINYKLNNVWFNIHNFPQERVTMCKKKPK